MDGDHLADAILLKGLRLSVFYQNSKTGYPKDPQQQFRLDDQPCVLFPAKLGKKFESILVLTSEGMTELSFTNLSALPARAEIIKQETIIPKSMDETNFAVPFSLVAKTDSEWPLLLLPVAGGLQIWQHRGQWLQAQFIEGAVETYVWPSVTNAGYTRSFDLNLSVGDLNGDGRDDLIVETSVAGTEVYKIYAQNSDGLFAVPPMVSYTNKADWHVGIAWTDINRDGKPDLIKSSFLDEPFFVPGMRSGKVVVGAYLADLDGMIPAEPQYIFRKNDWSRSLPVVDVDGDGFVDMVMGHIPINSRESLRKAVTAQEVDFTFKFYFFRPTMGFPKNPDYERDVIIHFSDEFFFTEDRRLYYEQFVSLNGDFNGDGKKDLLVRDRRNEISVYFFRSREKGFSTEPDIRFRCPGAIAWWKVMDLNGDGISDLIVKLHDGNGYRIFISQAK